MFSNNYPWKKAPFIRLLIAFIIGIIIQWNVQLQLNVLLIFLLSVISLILISFFFTSYYLYKLSAVIGLLVLSGFILLGCIVTWKSDIRNDANWYGNIYHIDDPVLVTLKEPLVEKANSYKALASVNYLFNNNTNEQVKGDVLLYFEKNISVSAIQYGSQIIFSKTLQPIKNTANPGGFDYKRYSLFQGITHQVFLKKEDFKILPQLRQSWFKNFLYSIQNKVLEIIRKNIPGEKEQGLAEALLIGYKDDLDKTLVQSYSNTGVVHVIAISGLHLGLIYWLLVQLLKPLKRNKKLKWLSPVLIISSLWLFSLLAGAQPSVLRSAVMFTCIVLGESFSKKISIYNTLAASAFILLCINPYWLWDVGFQLSYAAVLSIIIFMKPIYNLIYTKNKILDFIWKLNAVTLAAQLITTPISIYHFHQFPTYFILTNFVAVPLSSIIVLGEILLCTVTFIPGVASLVGKILSWLIWIMNSYVEYIEKLPGSLWNSLQISIPQAATIIIAVAAFGYWLLEKRKIGWWLGLASLFCFFLLRSVSFIASEKQQKIIVYNVPKHRAIDFIEGPNYFFSGDTDLLADDFLRNFHLQPSRILNRTTITDRLPSLQTTDNLLQFSGKNILLLDETTQYSQTASLVPVDIIIISHNPKLYITQLVKTFQPKQIIADASTPSWKQKYWAKDCDSLHIPFHSIVDKGAFVMNLN